jgi:hypothetical protein
LTIDYEMDGQEGFFINDHFTRLIESLGSHWRCLQPSVLGLRCYDLDVVSSYSIATMRHIRFDNLWWQRQSRRAGDGGSFRAKVGVGEGGL